MVADAVSGILFMAVGIHMAHRFYVSPRKKWQIVLAWALGIGFCVALGWCIPPRTVFPSKLWVQQVAGLNGLAVYFYLFPQVPRAQKVFIYFFVDTAMALCVLVARAISVYFAPHFHVQVDGCFLAIYLLLIIIYLVIFLQVTVDQILRALQAFQDNMSQLALFASVGYLTILLKADPWGDWGHLRFLDLVQWLLVAAFYILCYMIAFRVLAGILEREELAWQENMAKTLLQAEEAHYEVMMEKIIQMRGFRHDLKFHLNTLQGICQQGDTVKAQEYLAQLSQTIDDSQVHQYCSDTAVNSILHYYKTQYDAQGIAVTYRVKLPSALSVSSMHLCLLLGNSLQNALEACQVCKTAPLFLRLQMVYAHGRLVMRVENSSNPVCIRQNQVYPENPQCENRGLGLGNVARTVEHYHGWMHIHWQEGVFRLEVSI